MNNFSRTEKIKKPGNSSGAILIYVLWILVVISVLAFQLTSGSRATMLNQSAFAKQLKVHMQLESAIQYAMFKIASKQWKDAVYKINLNDQEIDVEIFNESGFISFYRTGDSTRQKMLEGVGLDDETIEALDTALTKIRNKQGFNSFYELRQFSGINDEMIKQLIPLASIYHQEALNPMSSPPEVLMQIPGIDQFRVRKLDEAVNDADRAQLRREITGIILGLDSELYDEISPYFRVRVRFNNMLHQVFLKVDQRKNVHKVVGIESGNITETKIPF